MRDLKIFLKGYLEKDYKDCLWLAIFQSLLEIKEFSIIRFVLGFIF